MKRKIHRTKNSEGTPAPLFRKKGSPGFFQKSKSFFTTNDNKVQREESKEEDKVQKKEEEKEDKVQTKKDGASHANVETEKIIHQSKGKGSPLPEDLKREMNEKFDNDFHKVRIHTGAEADRLCEDLQAVAFTHGYDIYFAAGKYDTTSAAGKNLIAHELTHVIQQRGYDKNAPPDQPENAR